MQTPEHALTVIKRHYREGERLDVAGLNQITVLVDRSQTALTEVGLNVWRAGLEGPPHFHDGKEQIFFVLGGRGTVTVSGERFPVKPNDLVYVPVGAMHQTVVESSEPLAYLLFNAFTDPSKEGQASFAEHIAEAKHERRRQADQAARGVPSDWSRAPARGRHVVFDPITTPLSAGAAECLPLLERELTQRSSACLIQQTGSRRVLEGADVERTLLAVAGEGAVRVGGERWPVGVGHVLFVPAGHEVITEAGQAGLAVLCLSTFLS